MSSSSAGEWVEQHGCQGVRRASSSSSG
ncbi:hypothetical protein HaLaN_05771 [Haematococcus lacustris]|uniref:Uncharacterized protein n=1 Tax=Haematococcus lacustris TaxID=44745 RepID=A0A699YRT8_HAELA|nr:hypothetical protein HaLaN_05771 [Haematococcus lacustris]